MGLEGLVSNRRDHSHRLGRSNFWVMVRNRKHPAMKRATASCLNAECYRPFPHHILFSWKHDDEALVDTCARAT
jgi:hypothetical protein